MLRISVWLCMAIIVLQWQIHLLNSSHNSFNYCELKCPLFDPPFGAVLLPGPSKNHFFKCNFGVGILFRCSHGNHFNPRKRVCDRPRHARAVVCHGSPDYEDEGSGDDDIYMRSKRLDELHDTARIARDDLFRVSRKRNNNKQKSKRLKALKDTRLFNKRQRHCRPSEHRHC